MFNGVKGDRIKNFFKRRQGRNLRFASNKPVKIHAGFEIEEIAQGAVKNNTDNLIIASLKATIEDLKIQLGVHEDERLQSKLEWAIEYLDKFEKEVKRIRTRETTRSSKEQTLELSFKNIERQRNSVLSKIIELSTVITKDTIEDVISKIDEIYEQIALYEKSIKRYQSNGGNKKYTKLIFDEFILRGLYSQIATEIDSLKDELTESTAEKNKVKECITKLEQFADDLAIYAESPVLYNQIRIEIDNEIARKKVKKPASLEEPVEEPTRPPYQDAIEAYERELAVLNQNTIKLNQAITKVEELIQIDEITPDVLREYINLSKQITSCREQISNSKRLLINIAKNTRDNLSKNIEKLAYIQNIAREEEKYNIDYDTYIELLDRKSVKVISKIKELLLSKTNASEEKVNRINQEISFLYEVLKGITSLIDSRMIYHSRKNKKDLNELHKVHFENRKKIATENEITNLDSLSTPSDGKKPEEVLREKIQEISNRWLIAIKTAPISRSGIINLDETSFANEITSLLAQVNNEEMMKIILECSNDFNEQRTQITKTKKTTLDNFRNIVKQRLMTYFRRGPVTDSIIEGVHHTEWLTEVEYIDMITSTIEAEEKAYIPNLKQLIEEYIQDEDKRYQEIKKHQKLEQEKIKKLAGEFAKLTTKVDSIPIDEQFEQNIIQIFEDIKLNYSSLRLDYQIEIEKNTIKFMYQTKLYEYKTGAYIPTSQEFSCVIMGHNKYEEYQQIRGLNQEKPLTPPTSQNEETTGVKVEFPRNESSNPKVTNRTLKLATNRRQVINRAKNLIIKNADSLTVSLIKQGLRISYNENLRDQLKSLNAKLSLVNKTNYRSRKDIKFQGDETMQDLAFKMPKENFNIEDYKLEVRLVDSDKKRSDLLYSIDLETISNELHGRTK